MEAKAFSRMQDDRLVAEARGGTEAAFGELYRRHRPAVAAHAYRIVRDPGRAEDVAQEAFTSALRRLRVTDAPITFQPWIHRIARNAAIDALRRSRRAEELPIDGSVELPAADRRRLLAPGSEPYAVLASKERLEELRNALRDLPEHHCRIIVLRELEGLSYREIGERMSLSGPAVESMLLRARRALFDARRRRSAAPLKPAPTRHPLTTAAEQATRRRRRSSRGSGAVAG
jgi:RNA polymerase sigma factor (sigma-70 family)